jgi:hypothetical protein
MTMQENKIPEIVKKRIEIAKLFYPLERKLQRRLAKNLVSGFNDTLEYLNELAERMNFSQTVLEKKYIIWKGPDKKSNDCMFCIIEDITKLSSVVELYEKIKKYSPVFTYAFVNQKKEGNGVFDIFRFSKFSYLEHCNRVKYP